MYNIYDKFPIDWRDDTEYTVFAGNKLIQFINSYNYHKYSNQNDIANRENVIDSWFIPNLDNYLMLVYYAHKPVYTEFYLKDVDDYFYVKINSRYKLLRPHSIELI